MATRNYCDRCNKLLEDKGHMFRNENKYSLHFNRKYGRGESQAQEHDARMKVGINENLELCKECHATIKKAINEVLKI